MDPVPPAAAKAAEEEAKRQAGTDVTPAAELAEAASGVAESAADGTLGLVIEGVGSVLGGALEVVGGILGAVSDP